MAVVEMIYRKPSTKITIRYGAYIAEMKQGRTVSAARALVGTRNLPALPVPLAVGGVSA